MKPLTLIKTQRRRQDCCISSGFNQAVKTRNWVSPCFYTHITILRRLLWLYITFTLLVGRESTNSIYCCVGEHPLMSILHCHWQSGIVSQYCKRKNNNRKIGGISCSPHCCCSAQGPNIHLPPLASILNSSF